MTLSDLSNHYYAGEPGGTLFHMPYSSDSKEADEIFCALRHGHDTLDQRAYALLAAQKAEAGVDQMLALLLPTDEMAREPARRKVAMLQAFRLIPDHLLEATRLLDEVRTIFTQHPAVACFEQLAREFAPTADRLTSFARRRGLRHAPEADPADLFGQVSVLAAAGLGRYVENVRWYVDAGPRQPAHQALRQTQQRLDAMYARYLELYERAPVGYCSMSPDGVVVQANRGAARLLGVPRGKLVGLKLERCIFAADLDAFHLLKRKVAAGGDQHRCEVRLARVGQDPVWVQLSASAGADDAGAPLFLMAFNDIDALKQTQCRLTESEYRWKFAIDGAGDGLWDWNIAENTLYLSTRWKNMLGYDADEICDGVEAFWARVHPHDQAHTADALRAHLAGETPVFNVEHRLRHKDGRWIWMQDRGAVVARNGDGATARMIGVHSDISERRKAAQLLRQLHAQLGELNRHQDMVKEDERKRIAGEIHDDLGQNLLALRLDVAMLHSRTGSRHPHLHQRATAVLECIDRTVRSVRNIINNLRPAVLDLGLEAAFAWQVRQFERSTGIRCKLTITGALMRQDERRDTALFRVLQESLTNVSRHAEATLVTVDLAIGDAVIALEVEDNGKGMRVMPRRDGARSYGLMGLKERVESFGGDFEVHSRQDHGVRLSVAIPVRAGAADAGGPGAWGGFFKLFGLGPDD